MIANSRWIARPVCCIAGCNTERRKGIRLEFITGSVETGKSADLVVLDRNVTGLNPHEFETAKVVCKYSRAKSYTHADAMN